MSGHLIKFKELFKDNRQYVIPEYQRGYSWETRHREDLLDDIERVYKSDRDYKHFTGTIVAAGNGADSKYEIVDGQQRMTSLFLLSKILNDHLDHKGLRKITAIENKKLCLNKETHDYFYKLVYDGTDDDPGNKSQLNLLNAREEFKGWVSSHKGKLSEFANIVLNQLGFLLYEPKASKEMGIMFEVINNRGKPLSQLEKVKNYLTYYAQMVENPTIEDQVIRNWPDILANLSEAGVTSNDEENSFLRYCWICFNSKNKQESYHVYENLKKRFKVADHNKTKTGELKDFIIFLVNCSKYYVDFFDKDDVSEPIIQLRHHPQYASVMPLYMAICEAFNQYGFSDISKSELLNILEKANFRIYVCPDVTKRSDTHQGKFFGDARYLYKRILNGNKKEVGEELVDLKERLKKRIQNECDARTFIKSLTLDRDEDFNYMKWNGLKYFLANYEIEITRKNKTVWLDKFFPKPKKKGDKPDDIYSKEHLWATDNRVEKNNDREKDFHEKKRLGNFVLLEKGINSRGSKASVKDKIDIYSDRNRPASLQMVWDIEGFYNKAYEFADSGRVNHTNEFYYELYAKLNDLREEELVNFAFKRWGLDSEKNIEVKVDTFEDMDKNEIFSAVGLK